MGGSYESIKTALKCMIRAGFGTHSFHPWCVFQPLRQMSMWSRINTSSLLLTQHPCWLPYLAGFSSACVSTSCYCTLKARCQCQPDQTLGTSVIYLGQCERSDQARALAKTAVTRPVRRGGIWPWCDSNAESIAHYWGKTPPHSFSAAHSKHYCCY